MHASFSIPRLQFAAGDVLLVLAMAIFLRAARTARSAPAGERQPAASGTPVKGSRHCIVFAADIAGFTSSLRDDYVQLALRAVLYRVLAGAFTASGIDWAGCHNEDRGDGALVVIPATVPTITVIDPLISHLRAGLHGHNRLAVPAGQIRLRVAVHVGEVHFDEFGVAGAAVNHLFRLLDAGALRAALAPGQAELAVIASGYLYESVIRHDAGLCDFREVVAEAKNLRARAWIHVPGGQPGALTPRAAGRPARARHPAPPAAN